MNILIKLLIFVAVCCIVNGHPYSDPVPGSKEGNCAAQVSALPPDPKTECCGIGSGPNIKLLGGLETLIDEYPWIALIEYNKDGRAKTPCGGALISGKYVLTAAHCVSGSVLSIVGKPENIILGEYDTSHDGPDCQQVERSGVDCTDGVTKIPIEKIISHPEYNNKEHKNDIALIRMTQLAPYTDFIRPICLPTIDIALITVPVNFKKAGWATIDKKPVSALKLQVNVPYVLQAECQAEYNTTGRIIAITKSHLCAGGNKGLDFCKGDGGLPLMYENSKTYEATGIVSFGPAACVGNIPLVYTNVYEYKSWIMSNIEA